MRNLIFLLFTIQLILIQNSIFSFAQSSYLKKNKLDPQSEAIRHQTEIRFFDRETLPNQGKASTCYGSAAYFLLQFHYFTTSLEKDHLSLLDVILRGSEQELREGGHSAIILKKISGQEIALENPLEKPKNFGINLQKIYSLRREQLKKQAPDHPLPIKWPHPLLNPTQSKVQPAQYNVHIFDPLSPKVSRLLEAHPQWSREIILIREVQFLLQQDSHATPLPIAFGFCASEDPLNRCTSGHEAIIVGSRIICSNENPENCRSEWKVINSWGEKHDGWFDATLLARGILRNPGELTYIRSCGTSEPCSAFFVSADLPPEFTEANTSQETFFPLHFLAATESLDSFLTYLRVNEGAPARLFEPSGDLSLPAHFAASFKQPEVLAEIARLAPESLTQKDRAGFTPALLAAGVDCANCLIKIAESHPNLFQETDPVGNTLAHIGAARGADQVLALLAERAPDLFLLKNQLNQTPAQIVSLTERSELSKWIENHPNLKANRRWRLLRSLFHRSS